MTFAVNGALHKLSFLMLDAHVRHCVREGMKGGMAAPFYLAKLLKDHFAAGASIINIIANVVLFLASDKAGFITGENVCVDGGMTRQMIYHNDFGWTLSRA